MDATKEALAIFYKIPDQETKENNLNHEGHRSLLHQLSLFSEVITKECQETNAVNIWAEFKLSSVLICFTLSCYIHLSIIHRESGRENVKLLSCANFIEFQCQLCP